MPPELTQQQLAFGLVGPAGSRPNAGEFPYGKQAGNLFLPTDGSTVEVLKPDGLGGFVWTALTGGGGVASVVAGDAIRVTGPAANPIVSVFVVGQTSQDLLYFNGTNWSRLPRGTNGQVLSVVGGALQWVTPSGGGGVASVTAGEGILTTGTPTNPVVNQGYPGQQIGDVSYRGTGGWARLPIGTPGQLLTVNLFGPNNELFYRDLFSAEPIVADFSSGVSYQFNYGYAAQQIGDLSFCVGAYPIQWQRLPIGSNGQVLTVVAGLPQWSTPAAVVSWDLYVSATGNDANDGLTPATALRTINRAVELAPTSWTGTGIIHVEGGLYNTEPLWQWIVPTGTGNQKGVLLIDCPLQQVFPPQVATAGVQGAAQNFGQITIPGPLVPGAHEGMILECQTGANAGFYRITGNGVTTIDISQAFPNFSLVGETFRIVAEAAFVTLPGSLTDIAVIAGQLGVCFSGVRIDLSGSVFVAFCPLLFNLSSWRGTIGNGQIIVSGIGQFGPATPALVPTPTDGFSSCGTVSDFDIGALDGGIIRASGWFKRPIVASLGSKLQCENLYLTDAGGVLAIAGSSGTVTNLRANAASPPQQGVVMADRASTIDLSSADISGSTTGAVTCANNSNIRLFSVLGGGNGGNGLLCYNHSRCQAQDANIGTLVSGGLGDVQVGSNAAPSTWAQIAAGAAVDVLDLTAVVPTLAAVTTT